MNASKPHPVLDPARYWHNSLYLTLLGVFAAVLVELLKEIVPESHTTSTLITAGVCCGTLFGIRLWYNRRIQQWLDSRGLVTLSLASKPVRPSAVLIALCGPSRAGLEAKNPAYEAAAHHRTTLRHIWLVTSHGGQSTAKWVNKQVSQWVVDGTPVKIHELAVLDDMSSVDLVKAKVESLRAEAMGVYRIDESEIVCDFTGMGKPATAGMVLACAPRGRRLSYLQGQYDADGKLMPDTASEAIEIEIEFQVESE